MAERNRNGGLFDNYAILFFIILFLLLFWGWGIGIGRKDTADVVE